MPQLYHVVPRSQDKIELHDRRSNYPWIVQYTLLDEHKLRCTVQYCLEIGISDGATSTCTERN